ncbi:MAG: hypothetical protein JSR46_03895 [Verrucomicrobia bacterium]|nr:hypothetical protein [Verrucomicrobiota bacterium]
MLTVFSSILHSLTISSKSLNDHIFTIEAFIKYSDDELLQESFASFLKMPMRNRPKLKYLVDKEPLDWAKHYLQAFADDCENNLSTLVERHIDSFISDSKEDIEWKEQYLQDRSQCIKELDILPKESDLLYPLKGVCGAVAARILQKIMRPNVSLEEIVAKYSEGVGKKTAGLHSFYTALCDMFQKHKRRALTQDRHPITLMHERIGIHTTQLKDMKGEGKPDQEIVEKICLLEEGCYELSICVFDVLDENDPMPSSSHAIFIRKQKDDLDIVDPNIGLLKGQTEEEKNELVHKLLSLYFKENKPYVLQPRKLINTL